jgi:hypothetical protein
MGAFQGISYIKGEKSEKSLLGRPGLSLLNVAAQAVPLRPSSTPCATFFWEPTTRELGVTGENPRSGKHSRHCRSLIWR